MIDEEKEWVWFSGRCRRCGAHHLKRFALFEPVPAMPGAQKRMEPSVDGRLSVPCVHFDIRLVAVEDGVMVTWGTEDCHGGRG